MWCLVELSYWFVFKQNLIACYLKRCVLKMLVIFWVITPTSISLLINPVNPRSNTVYHAPVNVLCSCCRYFSTHRKLPDLAPDITKTFWEAALTPICPPVSPLNIAVGLCLPRTEAWSQFWFPPFLTPSSPPSSLLITYSNSVSIHLFFLLKCWIHSCLFLTPKLFPFS